jgi:hypothetical protein
MTINEDDYTNLSYYNGNMVKASALNNPYIFPVANSYPIGVSDIIGLCNVSEEMSQGQFGAYPMIAFTKSGVWAMQVGSGDTLISSVVPLANEICINEESIISIRKGIFFATNEGLKILQGANVVNISQILEGSAINYVKSGILLQQLAQNLSLSLSDVDFLDYLTGAKIGYDSYYEEIIVSNANYDYSYVFSLENKYWSIVSGHYDDFVNQFPFLYGVVGSNVLRLSDEETRVTKRCLIITNPIGQDVFFKIKQLALRGVFDKVDLHIFASTDNESYHLITNQGGFDCSNIITQRGAGYSYRSVIIVISGSFSDLSWLSKDVELTIDDRLSAKLR